MAEDFEFNEGVVYRWNGAAEQFDIVSKPAGYLK